MFVILALSYRELLTRIWRRYLATAKVALAIAVTFLALQGGGAMTYLIHSEPVWYWQGGPLTSFNTQLQKVVTTLVIGAKK
jgi:methylthioribose-1-phosphate isomerase